MPQEDRVNLFRFDALRCFESLETVETSRFVTFPAHLGKQSDNVQTEAINQSEIAQNFACRSIKKNVKTQQTSFENSFQSEHLTCIKAKIGSFLKNTIGIYSDHFLCPQVFGFDKATGSLRMALEQLAVSQAHSKVKQFEVDLHSEIKLSEFLEQVCALAYSDIAMELVFLAMETYEVYLKKVQGIDISYSHIREVAYELTERRCLELFESENMNSLTLRHLVSPQTLCKAELFGLFKDFIHAYCETVLFVVCEYFTNPNCLQSDSKETGKRNFDNFDQDGYSQQEDLPFEGASAKKIKH